MASPRQDYSTLEAVGNRHSNLEPLYYSPDYPASPQDGAEVFYRQEPTAFSEKEASQNMQSNAEVAPASSTATQRRYCGLTARIALVVVVVLLLVIVGAIVGAVVGTRSKNNNSASTTPDISSSSAEPLPTTTFQCPEFEEHFRSDYWYAVGTRHSNRTDYDLWTVYLQGTYKHDVDRGTVRSVLVYNDTELQTMTDLHWQFRRLDREPLGQLGCNETAIQRRLYKIVCRLQDSESDVDIRLGLDLASWEAVQQSGTGKPRVRLVKEDDTDLSQVWYVEYRNETGWDWYEIRNFGVHWLLAANTGDAEPWMEGDGMVYTMWGRDMTRTLITAPWL